jgi:type IV pilus assembly protein PilV
MQTKFEQQALARTQSGFSLIESLVALVVLSVGMIGIASLYGQGLSAGRTALYRTIAVNLAGEMADRIRANRLGRAAYTGAGAVVACGPGGGLDCTPAQLASYDVFLWRALVAAQLPGGVGTVSFTMGTPPTYTINVAWQDVGGGTNYQITPQIPIM